MSDSNTSECNSNKKHISKLTVLVTGAGGFAGSHLVEELVDNSKYEVFAVTYSDSNFIKTKLSLNNIFSGDLTDYTFTSSIFKQLKPDIVFHLAAISTVHDSTVKAKAMLTTNMVMQYNILEAMMQHSPSSLMVAICSANQYGLVKESETPIKESQPFRPLNPYAVSKISQEYLAYQYHLSHKLNIIRVRAFNHTGERQTTNFVIPAFAKQIAEIEAGMRPPTIKVGNLDAIRDFSYVKDIVRAYISVAENGTVGSVYNVGSGKGIKISDMLRKLINISNIDINVEQDKSRMRPSDVPVLIADISKITRDTGWQPSTTIDEVLKKVLNYWRDKIRRS